MNLKYTFNVNFCLKTIVNPYTDKKTEIVQIKESKIDLPQLKMWNQDNWRWNQNRGHTTNKKNRDSTTDEYIIQRRLVAFLATNWAIDSDHYCGSFGNFLWQKKQLYGFNSLWLK